MSRKTLIVFIGTFVSYQNQIQFLLGNRMLREFFDDLFNNDRMMMMLDVDVDCDQFQQSGIDEQQHFTNQQQSCRRLGCLHANYLLLMRLWQANWSTTLLP
jgi:hypothetical protein